MSDFCPVCGSSIIEIKKTGCAGCHECYAIFKNQIKDFLESKGIEGKYTGSMPERLSSFRSVLNDRIALQNKLDEALQNENYEKAAMYRDYLKALEKNPVSSSGENDE